MAQDRVPRTPEEALAQTRAAVGDQRAFGHRIDRVLGYLIPRGAANHFGPGMIEAMESRR